MTHNPAILEALARAIHCHDGRLPTPWDADMIARWPDDCEYERKVAMSQAAAAVLELIRPKPLVWDVFECGRGAKATAWRKANYLITRWSDGRFELVESYPGYQGDNIAGAFMPTLEAAQAAAQAHADAAHWKNTKIGGSDA